MDTIASLAAKAGIVSSATGVIAFIVGLLAKFILKERKKAFAQGEHSMEHQQIAEDIAETTRRVGDLEVDVAELKGEMIEVKGSNQQLFSVLSTVRDDVTMIKKFLINGGNGDSD